MGLAEKLAERDPNDRRTSQRFPLRLPVRYRAVGNHGHGTASWRQSESINISSTGILFRNDEPLSAGQGIEVCVSWPVALDSWIPLKLSIKGPIVRVNDTEIAVRFERHEFRTRSTEAPAAA